jgi:hypothetical protein
MSIRKGPSIEELLINYPDDYLDRIEIVGKPTVRDDGRVVECIVVVQVPVDSVTITFSLDEDPENVTPKAVAEAWEDMIDE